MQLDVLHQRRLVQANVEIPSLVSGPAHSTTIASLWGVGETPVLDLPGVLGFESAGGNHGMEFEAFYYSSATNADKTDTRSSLWMGIALPPRLCSSSMKQTQ